MEGVRILNSEGLTPNQLVRLGSDNRCSTNGLGSYGAAYSNWTSQDQPNEGETNKRLILDVCRQDASPTTLLSPPTFIKGPYREPSALVTPSCEDF